MGEQGIIPNSVRINRGGKADHVLWDRGDGDLVDLCVCLWNADFSLGCIANVLEKNLESVLENDGAYPDMEALRLENEGRSSWGCDYCYAGYVNQRNIKPRKVTKTTREDMEVLVQEVSNPPNRIIRLGKSVEVGHIAYRETLIAFLELCERNETRVILPTKMLEYDPKVARLLKRTNSAVNFSIGMDKMEPGPVSQGFTNDYRIQQAKIYKSEGVQASVTLTCDQSASFDFNAKLGYSLECAMRAVEGDGPTLRLLPIRIHSDAIARIATGRTWYDLQATAPNGKLFHQSLSPEDVVFDRPYKLKRGSFLVLRTPHSHFVALYAQFDGKRIGACGVAGAKEYCDKCSLPYGNVVPHMAVPVEEIVKRPEQESAKQKTHPALPLFRNAEPI